MTIRTMLVLALIGIATVAHFLWIGIVGRQYGPTLLFTLHAAFFLLTAYPLLALARRRRWWTQVIMGAFVGLVAAALAAATITLVVYGPDQWSARFLPTGLTLYPIASMGWLYGAVIAGLFSQLKRSQGIDRMS